MAAMRFPPSAPSMRGMGRFGTLSRLPGPPHLVEGEDWKCASIHQNADHNLDCDKGCGPAADTPLFDDLVGAGEDRLRDRQTERIGGLEVDDQLEDSGLLNRQVGGLLALQNPSGVNAGLAMESLDVSAIAD